LLLLGLLGPAIYAKKVSKGNAPPVLAGDVAAPSSPENILPGGEGGSAAAEAGVSSRPSPDEASQSGTVREDGEGLTGPGSTPTSGKSSPSLAPIDPNNGEITVSIAVVGKNGEILFGPAAVQLTKNNRWGDTALGALDATGLPYDISGGWSGFVESVAGQRNKGQAGWMYKVNEETPMLAADKKSVRAGDRIIWWYSKSMNIPPPSWDGLIKK